MKILTCLVVLALYYCCNATYSRNEPYYLIGEWKVNSVHLDSNRYCCAPNGTVRIDYNYNNTVTLTSESWTGVGCPGRTSSYNQVFYIDGSQTFDQLFPYYLAINTFLDETAEMHLEFAGQIKQESDASDHQYWTVLTIYQYQQFPCDCYVALEKTKSWTY